MLVWGSRGRFGVVVVVVVFYMLGSVCQTQGGENKMKFLLFVDCLIDMFLELQKSLSYWQMVRVQNI